MIISHPKTSFLGVVSDGDHDFEGPRGPKAHLDTVLTKPVTHHLGTPFSITLCMDHGGGGTLTHGESSLCDVVLCAENVREIICLSIYNENKAIRDA